MKITSINLRNFRNIENTQLEFHPHLNIFVGDNGEGKTNLIESLVYLSSGRSFRINQDLLLIKNDEEFSKIDAYLSNEDNISVVLSDKGKYMVYNDRNLNKLSDFIGLCNIVLFNPDDIQFYTQAPRKRRREIDYELGKSSKTYLQNLSKVNKLVQDRNAYLKSKTIDELYLEVLDHQISELSEYIIIKRKEFMEYISTKVNHYYSTFTEDDLNISFEYDSAIDLDKDNYKIALLDKMKESKSRDIEFKMTHVGIHRDDFIFKTNGTPITYIMSQGQRRILMITYKLAVIDWFIEFNDIKPIFCMDDLFSELDETKRQLVLDNINKDLQIFITTTDLDFIDTKKDKFIFKVEKGNISREVNT